MLPLVSNSRLKEVLDRAVPLTGLDVHSDDAHFCPKCGPLLECDEQKETDMGHALLDDGVLGMVVPPPRQYGPLRQARRSALVATRSVAVGRISGGPSPSF